jgi:hypothetical protein
VKEELVQMQGMVLHRVKNALVVALDNNGHRSALC